MKEASKVKQTARQKQHSTPKAVNFPKKYELPRVELVYTAYEPLYLYTCIYIYIYTLYLCICSCMYMYMWFYRTCRISAALRWREIGKTFYPASHHSSALMQVHRLLCTSFNVRRRKEERSK